MYLTWFDSNSWLLELAGKRILLDPWLVGSLSFGDAKWFFEGRYGEPWPIPEAIDLILLSQGLPDHAHPETLQQLDRAIPVVGSPGAAQVATALGFSQVTAIDHGQTFALADQVEIRATIGSPTGPKTLENGYILSRLGPGGERIAAETLYYEPHGYHPSGLADLGPIAVAITPLINLAIGLPLGIQIPIIQGGESALALARQIRPQVMLPTAGAGRAEYSGLLVKALRLIGSVAEFRSQLTAAGLGETQVIEPQPGDRFELSLPQPLPLATPAS